MSHNAMDHYIVQGMKNLPALNVKGYGLNRYSEIFVTSFVTALSLVEGVSKNEYLSSPNYMRVLSRSVFGDYHQKNVTKLLINDQRLGAFMTEYLGRLDTNQLKHRRR